MINCSVRAHSRLLCVCRYASAAARSELLHSAPCLNNDMTSPRLPGTRPVETASTSGDCSCPQLRRTAYCNPRRALRVPPSGCLATGDIRSYVPDSQDGWTHDILPWRPRHRRPVVMASPKAEPLVILPGFGNDTEDYVQPFGREDIALVTLLRERGWHASVVELRRRDWFNVGRALFTRGYFKRSLTTQPGYAWYLERVAAAVNAAREATGSDKVTLIGHSAGGWLGRAFLGDPSYGAPADGGPNPAVSGLVMLGSPQRPPPVSTRAHDMTGGALTWVNKQWPGAYFADTGVQYACVAGRSVRGNPNPAPANAPQPNLPRYAHAAYSQVSGVGTGVEGDSVVPVSVATLEGATNLVLDGVLHSMSKAGTFKEAAPSDLVWYGDGRVLDHWLHLVRAPPSQQQQQQQQQRWRLGKEGKQASLLPEPRLEEGRHQQQQKEEDLAALG